MDAKLKTDQGRAIVEGKTAVPFKTFVGLILQRKVLNLFKDWGKEPVIIDSELLTDLASAPQDTQENKEQMIMVTMVTGILIGVFAMTILQIALTPWEIVLKQRELLMIAGTLLGFGILVWIMSKTKRKGRSQKLSDAMEKLTGMVSK